jgi:hypothetical protein
MDITAGLKRRKWQSMALLIFSVFLFAATTAAGDLMSSLCNNQVVSVGDRKGEVLAKCGQPLSKSQDTVDSGYSRTVRKAKTGKQKEGETAATGKTKLLKPVEDRRAITRKIIKEREETWTYNIDGSYRFFIFNKEGKLARIETGRLAN